MLLFKLLTVAVLAHCSDAVTAPTACCLPDTFQMSVLAELTLRGGRIRTRIIVASDGKIGRTSIAVSDEAGGSYRLFADFPRGQAYLTGDRLGISMELPADSVRDLLMAFRCVPSSILSRPSARLTLAAGLDVTVYSGVVPWSLFGSSLMISVDATVTDSCQPVVLKIGNRQLGFAANGIFGNFSTAEDSHWFQMPNKCSDPGATAPWSPLMLRDFMSSVGLPLM